MVEMCFSIGQNFLVFKQPEMGMAFGNLIPQIEAKLRYPSAPNRLLPLEETLSRIAV